MVVHPLGVGMGVSSASALPEPVAPATRTCGIFARLASTVLPSTSLPSPTTIG